MYKEQKLQYKDYTIEIIENNRYYQVLSWKDGLPHEFIIIKEEPYFVQELNFKNNPINVWGFKDYATAKKFAIKMIKERLKEE